MKKLTPEQKLEVIREARECYKEIIQGSVLNYGVICGSIGRTLYNKGLVNKDYNNYMVREMFPELMKHKPEHVPPGGEWWPREDIKTRLEVFDELEIEYMAQIGASFPWYTKLFNKIKNLFSWKRN